MVHLHRIIPIFLEGRMMIVGSCVRYYSPSAEFYDKNVGENKEIRDKKYANLNALDKEIQRSDCDAFFYMKNCDSPL